MKKYKYKRYTYGDRVKVHKKALDKRHRDNRITNISPKDVGIFKGYGPFDIVEVAFLADNNWEGRISDIYPVKDENEETKWSFNSLSKLDIDYVEIAKELSKKNPLILIEVEGREVTNCGVLFHEYLKVKSETCLLPRPKGKVTNNIPNVGFIVGCEKTDFSIWIDWAKRVKRAKWPKNVKRKATVHITLAKI